jgi:hypothetical protein
MSLNPDVLGAVGQLAIQHNLIDPQTKDLKKGWEQHIAEMIKDSKLAIVGEGGASLSNVTVLTETPPENARAITHDEMVSVVQVWLKTTHPPAEENETLSCVLKGLREYEISLPEHSSGDPIEDAKRLKSILEDLIAANEAKTAAPKAPPPPPPPPPPIKAAAAARKLWSPGPTSGSPSLSGAPKPKSGKTVPGLLEELSKGVKLRKAPPSEAPLRSARDKSLERVKEGIFPTLRKTGGPVSKKAPQASAKENPIGDVLRKKFKSRRAREEESSDSESGF